MPNTILDKNDIVLAKKAITDYCATCNQLHIKLTKIIADLRKTGFIGEASNGFDAFYTAVTPALTTNLTGGEKSVAAMLNQLLTAVENALLGTVDPDLGRANSGAANADAAAAPAAEN